MKNVVVLAAAAWLCLVSCGLAQDAVPSEMLFGRTLFIKVGNTEGTAFTIDYLGKIYLVTARHVVAGLPERRATIQIRREDKWEDFQTVRTLFPPSSEADIAVFETDKNVPQPFKVTTMGNAEGVTMGQQVWFLGYPFGGLGSRWSNGLAPFIKRGTMSAIDGTNPDAVVLYIDGFNNPGFSGGPILFWSFKGQKYEIIGVVKGYRNDTAKVAINGQQIDSNILVNSGILVGYSIRHALQAIENAQEKRP